MSKIPIACGVTPQCVWALTSGMLQVNGEGNSGHVDHHVGVD